MQSIGDPYIIRPGRPTDIDRCAELNEAVHPYPGIGSWTRDLFEGHPRVRPEDFLVAERADGTGIAAALVGIRLGAPPGRSLGESGPSAASGCR